ncbi:HlyD family secretion protein [Celeribacter sp. ULVN23_4]
MKKTHALPTAIAVSIGIAGILLLLYAWHLPPFNSAQPTTENAYIRGQVTTIAPQLSGYISAVEVTDYQAVKTGDVIARLDDRIYRQKLAQAKAQLASAKAALEVGKQSVSSAEASLRATEASHDAAKSALEIAQTNWDRIETLHTRGVASQSDLDTSHQSLQQAKATETQTAAQIVVQQEALKSARVALAADDADIASANAAVALAEIDLDNTVIRVRQDGHLGAVSARVGQYVSAGTSLVTEIGKDVWIVANFKETAIGDIRLGDDVSFTVDALHGKTFHGKVDSFSPATASEYSLLSGSNATGNFTKIAQRLPIRISIDADQEMADHLTPGLSVVVEVETKSQT